MNTYKFAQKPFFTLSLLILVFVGLGSPGILEFEAVTPALISSGGKNFKGGITTQVDRGVQEVGFIPTDNGSPDAETGRIWIAAGTLAKGRHAHTATLLLNGSVIVVGGLQERTEASPGLASAEIYNPRKRTWSVTGSLDIGRVYHTANLLTDGKVLVVGGADGYMGSELTSVEIYDPVSGDWHATSSLSAPRSGHSGTRLADGRVLIVGGRYGNGFSDVHASSEIYDPVSQTWSPTGSMVTPRESHSATLLPDGRVLVVGGYNQVWLASAEIYDPSSGTWSEIDSPLSCHGVTHTATRMVLGKIFIVGGACGSGIPGVIAETDLYDPTSSTWRAAATLPENREAHTTTLLPGGRILVVGGDNGDVPRYSSALIFIPLRKSWIPIDSLATGRRNHTATLLKNGDVLVVGGWGDDSTYLDTAELYHATFLD